MPSDYDPIDSLLDIIENTERIARYIAGLDRVAFEHDGLIRDAVERCLGHLCEAAHRLGANAGEWMPDQPWHDIRAIGNRLRHAYGRIDTDIIWRTVTERLPRLEADAKATLASLRP